jgi:hypothetical protein
VPVSYIPCDEGVWTIAHDRKKAVTPFDARFRMAFTIARVLTVDCTVQWDNRVVRE